MTEAVFKLRVTIEPDSEPEPWQGEGIAAKVVKSVDERRYTLTMAYPANKPDIGVAKDGHRDFAGPDAVEEAAWSYLTKSQNVGLWHEDGTDGAARVVESYIYRGPDWTISATDGSEQVIKAGDWLVGLQWSEQSWRDVKEGRIGGISPQGKAMRKPADPAVIAGLRS